MGRILDILSGVGNLADLPGSMVRDILGGQNPLDQILSPFSFQNRLTGRDLNRRWGLAGEEDTGLNAAGGMATELATDPLSWLGAGALFKALRGAGKAASATGAAGRAVAPSRLGQALSRAATPATAYSVASPVAGAYLMGDNPEGAAWKNYVGAGLMAAPLVLGMAKGAKGLAGKLRPTAEAAAEVPRQGPFYSRLQEALLNAPEEFAGQAERFTEKLSPARTIRDAEGNIVKELPETTKRIVTQQGMTPHQQLQKYLEGKAHPQEIDWVLGNQFADQPTITRTALQDAFEKGKINLETQRHGGRDVAPPTVTRGQTETKGPFDSRDDAAVVAREIAEGIGSPVVRKTDRGWMAGARERRPEHGPLTFPDMLIPGGKNATEVPIRLGSNVNHDALQAASKLRYAKQGEAFQALARNDNLGFDGPGEALRAVLLNDDFAQRWDIRDPADIKTLNEYRAAKKQFDAMAGPRFPDAKHHFGDDVVAWTIHDQRKMPDGSKMRFVQELQSDWHQQGAKAGYAGANQLNEAKARTDNALRRVEEIETGQGGQQRSQQSLYDNPDYIAAKREYQDAVEAQSQAERMLPDAPFKGNEWTKLGIKQAIADAIESGDDVVAFAPPELVSRTQGMPIDKARKFYGEIVPNLVNEMLKPHGVKLEKMPLPGTKIGKKEFIASKTTYSMEDLRLASKDQIDEFAAKAGYSGQQQHEVYGFRIPDTMKKQAKTKGFPMMSVAPFAAAAGGGALARILQDRRQEPQA